MNSETRCFPSPYAFAGLKKNKDISTRIKVSHIIDAICEEYDTTFENICKPTRQKDIVECRHMTMKFLKMFTTMTLKRIGEHLGGLDHTTIIHGITTIQNRIDTEELMAAKSGKIQESIWRRLNDAQLN